MQTHPRPAQMLTSEYSGRRAGLRERPLGAARLAGILFALLFAAASAGAAPAFKDGTAELGLKLKNAAACWVDVDNDGWPDLCAGGDVWHNDGGKGFTLLAEGLGSVVAADLDNDGWVDLFSWQKLRLYRNEAGKSFAPVELPGMPKCVSRGACWGDFDGDGFVDLYVGGYEDWNANVTYPNLLLMNEQGRAFRLAETDPGRRSRGVTACDFDRDGDLDVYVSNYRLQANQLLVNAGAGRLNDAARQHNAVATSPGFPGGHSIGACWGDFDNDGRFDLFAGNFAHVDNRGDQPKSRFLRNLGPEQGYRFEDRGPCGIFYQESYATPAAGDCDNDGKLDLFFTTVYGTASFGRKNFPVLYRNEGGFRFTDATAAAGVAGLEPTYQAAWADFDRDGDLDLAAAGKLFVNQGSGGAWLGVRLVGDGHAVNRSAIGAQVQVKTKAGVLTRQVEAGTGEGNQNDLVLHFGLGDEPGPLALEVFWPNRKTQTVRNVNVGRVVDVRYETAGGGVDP